VAIIYIDYNIISEAGQTPATIGSAALRNELRRLTRGGHQMALSAWHAFELAKSKRDDHIASCCDLVEDLRPLWISNNRFVLAHELEQFLAASTEDLRRFAFNTYVSQMWSTYDAAAALVGETFVDTVRALRSNPTNLTEIETAANQTPGAVLIGREALQDGRLAAHQRIIDGDYFRSVLRRARPADIDRLVSTMDITLRSCPAVAVEESMTQLRVRGSFKPTASDAADLQHAIVPLAYCDYFVSNDKQLSKHCSSVAQAISLTCIASRTLPVI